MRKLSIVISIIFMSSICFAQAKLDFTTIDVAYVFEYGETTRTFNISQTNIDKVKTSLTRKLGKPKVNSLDTLQWRNANIADVGTKLTITLNDGLYSTQKNVPTYLIFTNKTMKANALKSLDSQNMRVLKFTVGNAVNDNIVNTKKSEKVVLDFLNETIIPKKKIK